MKWVGEAASSLSVAFDESMLDVVVVDLGSVERWQHDSLLEYSDPVLDGVRADHEVDWIGPEVIWLAVDANFVKTVVNFVIKFDEEAVVELNLGVKGISKSDSPRIVEGSDEILNLLLDVVEHVVDAQLSVNHIQSFFEPFCDFLDDFATWSVEFVVSMVAIVSIVLHFFIVLMVLAVMFAVVLVVLAILMVSIMFVMSVVSVVIYLVEQIRNESEIIHVEFHLVVIFKHAWHVKDFHVEDFHLKNCFLL